MREVARHAVTDVKTIPATGPGVFLGMSALGTVGDVAAAIIAGTTYAGSALLRGLGFGTREAQHFPKELFFLYEANRRLARTAGSGAARPRR